MKNRSKYPLVSIITPLYNREDLVEETILSILNQDYPEIEYIILNDGSTDKSLEVIKKYKNKAKIYFHKNMGEARTVNRGFKLAKGEFIMVVNSDDPLYPGAVSESTKFMQKNKDVVIGYPDWDYIDKNSKFLSHVKVHPYDFEYILANHQCIIGAGAIFHRQAIELTGGRDPSFRYVGDFDFWLRLGLKAKFAKIPKTLSTFRLHPNSTSLADQGSKMAAEDIRLINKFYSISNLPPKLIKIKKQALSSAHFHAAQVSGKNKKLSIYHFYQSFALYPRSIFNGNKLKAIFYTLFLKK